MTQGQWSRLMGERPSYYAAGERWNGNAILDSNPVTDVGWEDCTRVLPRFGLRLPTEAQWERSCRAESNSPWWCGDLASIAGPEGVAGNILDDGAMDRRAPEAWGIPEGWDDEHVVHAPVGTFRANGYGLHDVLGNVCEWCEDLHDPRAYSLPFRPDDGHRLLGSHAVDPGSRVPRGGSFANVAIHARSAYRLGYSPSDCRANLGLRPARRITRN